MRIIVFLLISSFIFCAAAIGQENVRLTKGSPIDFYKEEVTLMVSDSIASISGVYWFRNSTDIEIPYPVSFPFYVDSTIYYPDQISAYTISDSVTDKIPFLKYKIANSVGLRIPMVAKGTTIWHLNYSQKILSPHARYILTTTAAWGKPLEEAKYKFIVPVSFDSVQVWPSPDSFTTTGDLKTYWSFNANYMPKRDMEISWKAKQGADTLH